MNEYSREELLCMFGHCFQVSKTVLDSNKAISAEQNQSVIQTIQLLETRTHHRIIENR